MSAKARHFYDAATFELASCHTCVRFTVTAVEIEPLVSRLIDQV
jgi:hypothetical protein